MSWMTSSIFIYSQWHDHSRPLMCVCVYVGGGGIEKLAWGTTKVLKNSLEAPPINNLAQKRKW